MAASELRATPCQYGVFVFGPFGMLCDDSVIRPVSQLRHGSRRAADLLPSPFCVFVGMARNRQPKVTRWALAANVFILLLSGATAVFSITQLAGVVDAMGSLPAVHSVVSCGHRSRRGCCLRQE